MGLNVVCAFSVPLVAVKLTRDAERTTLRGEGLLR